MKYNGIELTPITEPQIFDPPKEMLVWCFDNHCETARKDMVCAITIRESLPIIGLNDSYNFCAEIPQQQSNRATNIQFTEWLAKGNGVWRRKNNDSSIYINSSFFEELEEEEVEDFILIRPFGTKEWLEPTLENMGMEEK